MTLPTPPGVGNAFREELADAITAIKHARDTAMLYTVAARIPECGQFGAIAQDLDFAIPVILSALRSLPTPPEAV